MHVARHLKYSTYLCIAAVVAASIFGSLAAVPFLPAAAVLCWLAIKATRDDDAPPLRWGMLFDREMIIGFCAGFAWFCWNGAQQIADGGWEKIGGNPAWFRRHGCLPCCWASRLLSRLSYAPLWLEDWLEDFQKWRAELGTRFRNFWEDPRPWRKKILPPPGMR
jgi:hypothetical protein